MGVRRHKTPAAGTGNKSHGDFTEPVGVRIIGGNFRGRKIEYSGDMRTRPMKDRVRESLFNRLGTAVKGKVAIDLFAGTGALGLESLSRGAARAIFIEQHMPTARAIQRSATAFGAEKLIEIAMTNTFLWYRRHPELPAQPWLVFCSPPYEFYVSRTAETLELVSGLMQAAPAESVFVVESDQRFDFALLPNAADWDVRPYPPAVVGIYWKSA
jgi:16S rRNA (guanine(966)-N(2))-methyltransferase RsmD